MSFARNEQIADFLNLYECSHPRIDGTSPGWDAHARLRRDVIVRHHRDNTALGRRHRNEPRVIWDAAVPGHGVGIDRHRRVSLRGVDFILLTVSARTAR
jgi:hypothetical protein